MSKHTFNERPIFVGRTSRWSLSIDFFILAIIIAALLLFVFAPLFVLTLVAPEFLANFMQQSPSVVAIIIIAACAFFILMMLAAMIISMSRADMVIRWGVFVCLLVVFIMLGGLVGLTLITYNAVIYTFVNAPFSAIKWLMIITGILTVYNIFLIIFSYSRALVIVSGQLDEGRRGVPNDARALRTDVRNHNRLNYVNFKLYKDQIVITDFTGWREWVYLVAGIYHIRVRQTWFGKSFNYGDVIIRSTGTAGQIVLPGIKKPHELKAILQEKIKAGAVNVGGFIPQDIN